LHPGLLRPSLLAMTPPCERSLPKRSGGPPRPRLRKHLLRLREWSRQAGLAKKTLCGELYRMSLGQSEKVRLIRCEMQTPGSRKQGMPRALFRSLVRSRTFRWISLLPGLETRLAMSRMPLALP